MGNTIGQLFKVTTFGESHGMAIGAVIDGCPAGLLIDKSEIQLQLDRRRPGQSAITSSRNEADEVEIMSGVFEGKTTGAPIALIIFNNDQQSVDYDKIKDAYRPSHADFTWEKKYGHRDYRGGGRTSARETAMRVAAGGVACLLLKQYGITVQGYVSQVGELKIDKPYKELDLSKTDTNIIRCPDEIIAKKMITLIEQVKSEGDTIGGTISCVITNPVIGLGEPVFDKLQADLAKAMLSINAAHGFDYGGGFEEINKKGSELNDVFIRSEDNTITTKSNFSGGILGGMSTGNDIYFRVLFKPVATLMQRQQTVDREGQTVNIDPKGRHDPCVLPRAVPIVEAMAALVLADHILRNRASRLR